MSRYRWTDGYAVPLLLLLLQSIMAGRHRGKDLCDLDLAVV